ncbi:MAG: AAA family ATPase [Candidatus Schekmanbacteria bacterium]|nr:AAA family ATPase [Candidatus Schekmanbacteria bacterium]
MIMNLHRALERQVGKVIVGQSEALRLVLIALVCEGHVLLEGVPGLAKTTLVRAVAAALGLKFGRIQFTPDLMPSDIVGTQIFSFQSGTFHLVEGPVFTNVMLGDEINRAPAKTQSALLEAMQERQVSIDGKARPLPAPFMVLATQNPVEQEGTYPLPEAQLDRFLFKIALTYPTLEEELRILEQHRGDTAGLSALLAAIEVVGGVAELAAAREEAMRVQIRPEVAEYLVRLVRRTRDHTQIQLGGSPRAALLLQLAARAAAAMEGREYAIPDDVKELFVPALRHRIVLTASAEVDGVGADEVLRGLVESTPVPR